MFDTSFGPPEDWEPIPDEVLAELGDWDDPVDGLEPMFGSRDDFVWEAIGRTLGVETLPLMMVTPFPEMSAEARSHALRRLDELSQHVEAIKAQLTAVIAGPAPRSETERREDYTPHEVAVATRCSVYAADTKIAVARTLATRLQASATALGEGRMTYMQAVALSEATSSLDLDVALEIETKMLTYCHRQDIGHFKKALGRWREKLDPDFVKKAREARTEPAVEHRATGDGCGELLIRGPLEITTQLSMALTAYAAKTKQQLGGTADARRLAGLRDMVESYLGSPDAPRQRGRLPIVNVTIDLPTLLNLRAGIAEIPGVGAIPPEAALWLLADGGPLRRLVTDPLNGQLLDYGNSTYTVPADLAEYLIAKNLTSATPHSHVPSAGCDMEHNTPHPAGPTNRINNTPTDRRWHRAKTHADWTYQKDPDTGTITWTSPTSGLTCHIEPHDYRTHAA